MRHPKPIPARCPLGAWFRASPERTQTVLADLSKLKPQQISAFVLHGRALRAENYVKLAEATGVPMEELIAWGQAGARKRAA
jgi:hypothetical protein